MTKRNEKELLAAFDHMANELGGTIAYATTYDSSGRSSKKITIEYNVKNVKRNVDGTTT